MSKEYNFEPSKYYYSFGFYEPALKLYPGDSVVTTTLDSRSFDSQGNSLPREKRYSLKGIEFKEANPVVGPFYIEGAEIGDTLVVFLEEISLNRNFAFSYHNPGFGALGSEDILFGPVGLHEPLPLKRFDWKLDHKNNTGVLELANSKLKCVEIPLHPFLGCIGVAPRFGDVTSSMSASEHGGNMDCLETKQGTTVYLPVFAKGALLFIGDAHAAQGDGEICGSGLETTAKVKFNVDILKEKTIRWPRLVDEYYIMVAASARPLLDAFKIAHTELINWLCLDYGFDRWDALQMVSHVGKALVGNVVNPKYTIVAKFPKKYLPH